MAGLGMVAALLLAYAVTYLHSLRGAGKPQAGGRMGWPDRMAPFRIWVKRARGFDFADGMLRRTGISLALLEGGSCPPERLARWAAEAAGMAYAALLAAWLLGAVSGSWLAGGVGTAVAFCLPGLRARDLSRKVETRKRQLLMELPVMLSRLLVLVNAGENVRRALERCVEGRPLPDPHPLYGELRAALSAMDRGESMAFAMEEFGRRCALPEANLFSAVLLMNARRGGEELVPALRDLNRQMWDKRKAAAKTLGEMASSRLAFPLVVVFLLIIVLVGAPAMMTL
ncbi:type II secretion system F family protein [Cohnella caldifontis]|uniref:type II secretion system F family protein n=1 Tax=Cohnella caldifontis TaxID=3027471 RepID=UPI0023EB00BB|nr:type II secretion system F family protein [Cohnella sp. YIM B05605]